MYKEIKVPARWQGKDGWEHLAVAHFTLGLGSCGKVVTQLGLETMPEGVLVTQWCGDEIKQFFYPLHTLTGRIEATML